MPHVSRRDSRFPYVVGYSAQRSECCALHTSTSSLMLYLCTAAYEWHYHTYVPYGPYVPQMAMSKAYAAQCLSATLCIIYDG